jgi:hypothetical protein
MIIVKIRMAVNDNRMAVRFLIPLIAESDMEIEELLVMVF